MKRSKNLDLLPKTSTDFWNGGVYVQYVRCGKWNCKCYRGEMHAAHYFMSRSWGKQVKTYVPKSEVQRIQELVDESRYLKWRVRRALADADEALRRRRKRVCRIRTVGDIIDFLNEESTDGRRITLIPRRFEDDANCSPQEDGLDAT